MKKLTILLVISVLFCLNAVGQTNLLRISLGENHIDVVSTITVDHGVTKIVYSSMEGVQYFEGQVNEAGTMIGDCYLYNDLPFETLTGGNTEQARTWAQCVVVQIHNCNRSFWCELGCLHGVNTECVLYWGIKCANNPNVRIETIE